MGDAGSCNSDFVMRGQPSSASVWQAALLSHQSIIAASCVGWAGCVPNPAAVQISSSKGLHQPVCRHLVQISCSKGLLAGTLSFTQNVQISSNKDYFNVEAAASANVSAVLACRSTSPLHRSLSATAACSGGLTTCNIRRTAQASLPRSTSGSPPSGRRHRLLQPLRLANVLTHTFQHRQRPGTVRGATCKQTIG